MKGIKFAAVSCQFLNFAIAYREALLKSRPRLAGKSILYFGCRRQDEDYLYGDEFQEFKQGNVLDKLEVAFSRKSEEKIYVQHLMLSQVCTMLPILWFFSINSNRTREMAVSMITVILANYFCCQITMIMTKAFLCSIESAFEHLKSLLSCLSFRKCENSISMGFLFISERIFR